MAANKEQHQNILNFFVGEDGFDGIMLSDFSELYSKYTG